MSVANNAPIKLIPFELIWKMKALGSNSFSKSTKLERSEGEAFLGDVCQL
jgi:hypothetical protein